MNAAIRLPRMFPKTLLALCICGLLAGCAMPGMIVPPTPYPPGYLPTVIVLTAQSINATRLAAITPTDTPTLAPLTSTPTPSTPLPTLTLTPAPGIPLAAIQINAPGPMSRIASPLELHLLAIAGDSHKIEVALFGEDGRVLGRTVRVVAGYPAGDPLSLKMPFEIRAAGENGIVQVSTKNIQGRIQSLTSVRVLLLSNGVSQINPPGNTIYERAVFYDLPIDAHISGGVLPVKGSYEPLNNRPVILELVGPAATEREFRLAEPTLAMPEEAPRLAHSMPRRSAGGLCDIWRHRKGVARSRYLPGGS